jgi:formylmethanofuran dehydrogenase subunit E
MQSIRAFVMEAPKMRWQPKQLELEVEAHHRALRRCHGCGAYARRAEEIEGRVRCERCAEKARRERDETIEDFSLIP